MYNLYFYTFNNYYNRQIKRYDLISQYDEAGIRIGVKTANFEFNDGVNTVATLNIPEWSALSDIPDYMILTPVGSVEIYSRWYVIEATQNSGGQYDLYLRRDLVADFYEKIIEAPAFIEKATLKTTDPLIWNSENMTYNQIKKGEVEIRDNTQMPWIVGYYALPNPDEDQSSGPINVGIAEYDIDTEVAGITNYAYYNWTDKPYYYLSEAQFQVNAWVGGTNSTQYTFFPQASTPYYTSEPTTKNNLVGLRMGKSPDETLAYLIERASVNLQDQFINTVLTIDGITKEQFNTLQKEAYKVIKDTQTNKIYKINVRVQAVNKWSKPRADIENDAKYNTVFRNSEIAVGRSDTLSPLYDAESKAYYQYNITQQQVIFSLDEITPTTGHYINIDASRRTLSDAPYCMFCMPYGELDVIYPTEGSSSYFRTNKANALTIGAGLLANKPGFVYDVQIMPFCPSAKLRRLIGTSNQIDMRELTDAVDYTTSAYGIKQIIFWADSSQGSIDISTEDMRAPDMTIEQLQEILNLWGFNYSRWDPEDAKVVSECSMYRLCSPNFASIFEYNLAKNAGINRTDITIDPIVFHVDYGYKPYNPYVRVAPIFGGLYGSNYSDARGLILQGDFSITAITNQWAQYELQNKNYQQAFDRQIENMEINNKYARTQDIVDAITGTLSGAGSGMFMGGHMTAGNPIAMGVGAGIGATASAIGGTANVIINQQLRNEALDYTKDNFGFALGNIQALPHTINKVSAINPNFRYFPILEIYDATDEEKNALLQKLKYNGMTVGRINTISAYLGEDPSYIKAQLIRLEDIADDTHVLNELANEIYKGVYI